MPEHNTPAATGPPSPAGTDFAEYLQQRIYDAFNIPPALRDAWTRIDAGDYCGFKLERDDMLLFICTQPPHPDRPHFHGNEQHSYNEATGEERRGTHYLNAWRIDG